jgi:hypothetical protein
MANASTTGFGLRAVMTVGNTPATSGQSEYEIQTAPGVASNKGDPMSYNDGGATAGDAGKVQDASFTTTDDGGNGGTAWTTANSALLLGVFNGAFYIDSTGKPTFSNNVVAGQTTSKDYNTGSDGITAFIIDNPNQEYVVKADAALAQTLLGVNPMQGFNTNNYTATDNKDGQSITTLDVGSAATTSMFTVVRNANDPENKDQSAAGCNFVVIQAKNSSLFN